MTRGVIYVYWGNKYEKELQRSIESLKYHHPELPYKVIKLPDTADFNDKAMMMDYSPFESTLFLDTDTIVMDKLDFGFERAEKWGLACCINECPWARRYGELTGDVIEYNTGVLFFTRKAKPLFDAWKECAKWVDSSIRFYYKDSVAVMTAADQGPFTAAIEQLQFNPFVLPQNWNFRPAWQRSYFGPFKIWHDHAPLPDWAKFWNESQVLEQSIIRFGLITKYP